MISVIVPAYNAARTLRRCVDSVLSQTYADFELILVDDGSKDSTAALCDGFDDGRVRVFHKVNGGVSSARNLGLDNAQGDYVSFVDADDYVEPYYLQNLMKGCESDLVTTGFCYGLTPPINRLEFVEKQYDTVCEIASDLNLLINEDRLCYPWGRLYRRSIIEQYHLRFDEDMRFAEDNVFVWQYLCHANSMYVNFSALDYHKDGDEGASPYHLSLEEIDSIDGKLFKLSKSLEQHYQVPLILNTKQLMHVLFLKDMLQLTASQWYGYYKKYHPQGTEKDGYDFIMQTVYYMTLIALSKTTDKQGQKQLLVRLDKFVDKPFVMLSKSSIKTRFLIPFIKLRLDEVVVKMAGKLFK